MTETQTATTTQIYQVLIKASAQRIWDAITKPEFTARYFHGARVETTGEAGTPLRYCAPDGVTLWGDEVIIEAEPPHKLVVPWRSLYDEQMAADLDLPVRIMGAPTLREADGLAMSSRNSYLGAVQRRVAAKLNRVLKDVVAWARSGDLRAAEQRGARALLDAGFDSVDYVAVRDGETLAMIEMLDRPARVLAAVRLGPVRLIDNMAIV